MAVSVFSLIAVNNVQAVSEHGNCTANNGGPDQSVCAADGFRCAKNPWFNGTVPAGAAADKDNEYICCDRAWGCVSAAVTGNATGLGDTDPREMAANVVNVILGFLGIIAVILILAGGFMWMTAAGNEDKVGTAKKVMTAGVVGLVIVLAAFGIAKFVIGALVTATK